MKVKYIGSADYTFHIFGISGEWKKGEWKEISEQEYEVIKNNKDFEVEKKGGKKWQTEEQL